MTIFVVMAGYGYEGGDGQIIEVFRDESKAHRLVEILTKQAPNTFYWVEEWVTV